MGSVWIFDIFYLFFFLHLQSPGMRETLVRAPMKCLKSLLGMIVIFDKD